MFGFGKKNKVENKNTSPETVVLTEEKKEEIVQSISLKKEEVKTANVEEQPKLYEDIGIGYQEIGEIDKSIEFLEKSIHAKKTTGEGYKILLRLYNKKRAEVAKMGSDKELQVWLTKIDYMIQVSKDVTRGVK